MNGIPCQKAVLSYYSKTEKNWEQVHFFAFFNFSSLQRSPHLLEAVLTLTFGKLNIGQYYINKQIDFL